MFLYRLWAYLLGYLVIRVDGQALERFLNACISRGIFLWDIRRLRGCLRAKIGLPDFFDLRPVVRASRVKVRIEERLGGPFLWRRVRRRKVLLGGAIVLLATLYYLSGFVWFVEIKGTEKLDPEVVREAAAELGLKPGARLSSFTSEQIDSGLRARMEEIARAMITIRGTKVSLEVVEKRLIKPDPTRDEPADIVAAKDGVIAEIVAFTGTPLVQKGDAVKAGDVLIRGDHSATKAPNPDDSHDPTWIVRKKAQGEVWADTWYDTYLEVPLIYQVSKRTGRTFERQVIKIRGRDIIIGGWGQVPFSNFEPQEIRRKYDPWRNPVTAVEFITTTYFEVTSTTHTRTPEEAINLAKAQWEEQVKKGLAVSSRIVKTDGPIIIQQSREFIGLRVRVTARENIAAVRTGRQPGETSPPVSPEKPPSAQ